MSATTLETEVLVVGYGPVGAATAALLGRYGVKALVVEKATDIFMAPRAIALDNEALRVLQLVGLADDAFEKVAIPFVKMHCPYMGQFAQINTAGSVDGHAKLVTFYQPALERALRSKVGEHASITTLLGTEVLSVQQSADGVQAELLRPDGRRVQVRAQYVVGADGASSLVRKAIGQDFVGETYAEDWLIVDALDVTKPIDHIEFLCDPRRPTPHMVAPGGRVRWEFMLQAGETREQMEQDETIHRLLAPWAKPGALTIERKAAFTIERKAVYRFHARCCTRFSEGRLFLVGDAAHITPPFAGQGLVAGLRDAANLGWKLAWVLRGHAGAHILESYDAERRPHARAMIGLAKFMGRLVMPRNAAAAVLVHGFMRLMRTIPPLRRLTEEQGVKPKNAFEKGLFVASGRGASCRLKRGACLPQGWVRDRDGRVLLSDDALGSGLTLLGFGRDARAQLSAATLAAWQAAGGHVVQLTTKSQTLHVSAAAFEDISHSLIAQCAPYGWLAVLRPDRTVLHDGPVEDAERLVAETLQLIRARP